MKINSICPECLGDGLVVAGEGSVPCGRCSGTGKLDFGNIDIDEILEWIKSKIKKILKKLEIEEG